MFCISSYSNCYQFNKDLFKKNNSDNVYSFAVSSTSYVNIVIIQFHVYTHVLVS